MGIHILAVLSLVFIGVASYAPEASAEEPSQRWRFGAEVGADFSLQIGAGLHVESPQRIRLHTSLGVFRGVAR